MLTTSEHKTPSMYFSLESKRNVAEGEDGTDNLHGLGRREAVGSRVALSFQSLQIQTKFRDTRRSILGSGCLTILRKLLSQLLRLSLLELLLEANIYIFAHLHD